MSLRNLLESKGTQNWLVLAFLPRLKTQTRNPATQLDERIVILHRRMRDERSH